MARKPQKPQRGQPAIKELYKSVCDIIDYLPSLEVTGDQKSTYVTKSSVGTVIHATQNSTTQNKSNQYYAGSGLYLSGNIFYNALSGDETTIRIRDNVISCISGGGGGPDTNTTYIGEINADCECGWIFVDGTPISGDTYVIRSNLRYLLQLYNYPLSTGSSTPHFLVQTDLKEGAGTTISYHRSSAGNHVDDDPSAPLITWVDGIQVDISMSGGRFISPTFYKGVGYGDNSSAFIDCLLSGDNSHIFITNQTPNADGSYGGIISTNIHGDGTSVTMDADGTLHAFGGGGGGTTSGCPWPDYSNLANTSPTVSVQSNYTAGSGGGWLRISYTGQPIPGCYGVTINGNIMGLYTVGNNMTTDKIGCTWLLPIPPYNTFVVNFPPQCTYAYFDGEKYDTGDIQTAYQAISEATASALQERNEAFSYYGQAKNKADDAQNDWDNFHENTEAPFIDPAENYYSWWQDALEYATNSDSYATNASGAADEAIVQYNYLIANNLDIVHKANDYKTSAVNYAVQAADFATSAHTEADRAHLYYLSAVDWWSHHQ